MNLQDIFFYLQVLVFFMNVLVFIYLLRHHEVSYNIERIILVVGFTVMFVINFGKVSWITVIFSFTPFIALFKIKQHGKLDRIFEEFRNYFRGNKQRDENIQRSNKTLSEQEA